jgi:cysteinyl-tRNA synthetase
VTLLRLYNTLSRTKEDFVPLDPANVRMYVCGPTVYDYAHIGNARPAIVFDVLFRLLRHIYGQGHVTYVRNITDIDDKINARAQEHAKGGDVFAALRELTEKTYGLYRQDVMALGCLEPSAMPRATENVGAMIAMTQTLIDTGYAYAAKGHVLFRVKKKADYGKLARRSLDDMLAGARVDVAPYKEDPMDFVLWKPSDAATPGWDSPWGRGRPGWHLECSAMIEATFKFEEGGETIDIHGGGIDLVFPHHENEIAQSEGAHRGHPLARYWMHNGFLNVEGEKMSKSLGNFVTINELLDRYPGGALRFAMLQTHYRQPINWTERKAEDSWSELRDWAASIHSSNAQHNMNFRAAQGRQPVPHPDILAALDDDLNTPEVITILRALYNERNERSYSLLIESCEFLGIFDRHTIGSYFRGVSGTNLGYDLTFNIHSIVQELKVAIINKQSMKVEKVAKLLADRGVGFRKSSDGDVHIHPLEGFQQQQSGEIERLIEARTAARKAKDFKESDRIRDDLLAKGIVLKDGPSGTTWEVKR